MAWIVTATHCLTFTAMEQHHSKCALLLHRCHIAISKIDFQEGIVQYLVYCIAT